MTVERAPQAVSELPFCPLKTAFNLQLEQQTKIKKTLFASGYIIRASVIEQCPGEIITSII